MHTDRHRHRYTGHRHISHISHTNTPDLRHKHMTISTENVTTPKSTKSRISNSSVQIQIKTKSQLEFVPRDTEKSEFLDLVDFGGVAISMETVISLTHISDTHT